MIAAALTALALAAEAAPAPRAPAYVSNFCAALALGAGDPVALRRLYASFGARSGAGSEAAAFEPQDAEVPGQLVLFEGQEAPHAFVEGRRGTCALVFRAPHAPDVVAEDFERSALPAGGGALARWRKLPARRPGAPGPARWFLPVGEDGRFGVCAAVFEDLRLRDSSPATLVKVSTCRLSGEESAANG